MPSKRSATTTTRESPQVDVWKTVCGPLGWEPGACRAEVRRRSGISTGIFSQGLLTGLWDDAEWFEEVWAAGDAVFRAVRPLELGIALKHWSARAARDSSPPLDGRLGTSRGRGIV